MKKNTIFSDCNTLSLQEVAPAKPSDIRVEPNEVIWHLTLDQIEAESGKIINPIFAAACEAGTSTHLFDERNVLYSKLRPYLNKVVCPDCQGIATSELVPLRPNPEILHRQYLCYYLRSEKFVNWISGQVVGAKMPRVNMKTFWSHEIPIPPLTEQRRIAAILDKADALRKKRSEALRLADEFLKSTFLDMFGDPVTNPMGWPEQSLQQLLLCIDSGKSPKCESRPVEADEWGVLKLGAVTQCEYCPNENKALLDEAPDQRHEVKEGDILFSRKNTYDLVAASCFVFSTPPKLLLPDLIFRLKIKDDSELNPLYLSHCLVHPGKRERIQKLASGAAGSMPNISKARLLTVSIPVPPIKMQLEFSIIVYKVREILQDFTMSFSHSEEIFNSLVQRAFKGELSSVSNVSQVNDSIVIPTEPRYAATKPAVFLGQFILKLLRAMDRPMRLIDLAQLYVLLRRTEQIIQLFDSDEKEQVKAWSKAFNETIDPDLFASEIRKMALDLKQLKMNGEGQKVTVQLNKFAVMPKAVSAWRKLDIDIMMRVYEQMPKVAFDEECDNLAVMKIVNSILVA